MKRADKPRAPNTVRAYLRVSTDEQAEEGYSLGVQRDRLTSYIRSQWDAVAVEWYTDDGASAKDLQRRELSRLRAEAQAGDVVLVLKLDRLTRSVRDLYELLAEWERRQIAFRSSTEPYDTCKAEGKFMLGLLGLLAEWERERIAERVREVMNGIMRSQARPLSKPPFGYRLVDGQLVVKEDEAVVVRMIFDEYIKGSGVRTIALRLNDLAIKAPEGGLWGSYQVAYMLGNPTYVGKLSWNRVTIRGRRQRATRGGAAGDLIIVDGDHQPLVTPEVWDAAQMARKTRQELSPRHASGDYALTGLAFCSRCGGPLSGYTQKRYKEGKPRPEAERAYYRCSRRLHYKTCDLPYTPVDVVERSVVEQLRQLADPAVLQDIARRLADGSELSRHRRRISELESRLGRLNRVLTMYEEEVADGALSRNAWRERAAAIWAQQEGIRCELAALRQDTPVAFDPEVLASQMGHIVEVWEELTLAERKTLLRGLIERITLQANGSVKVQPRQFDRLARTVPL